MPLKTWKDIEERALVDPLLHMAVTLVARGDWTPEVALIQVVLGMSEKVEQLGQRLIEELQNKPFSPLDRKLLKNIPATAIYREHSDG